MSYRRDLDEGDPGIPPPLPSAGPRPGHLAELRQLLGRLEREGTSATFHGKGGVPWRLTFAGLWNPCGVPPPREPGEDLEEDPPRAPGLLVPWSQLTQEQVKAVLQGARITRKEPTMTYTTFRQENPDAPLLGRLPALRGRL